MRYQTIRKYVDAIRWTGTPVSTEAVIQWGNGKIRAGVNRLLLIRDEPGGSVGDNLLIAPGTWFLRDDGSIYTMDHQSFVKTYEPPTTPMVAASRVSDDAR